MGVVLSCDNSTTPFFKELVFDEMLEMRLVAHTLSIATLATLVCVVGCSDDNSAGKGVNVVAPMSVSSPINPLVKAEDSIAIVNGVSISRSDYDKWVVLRSRVYSMANASKSDNMKMSVADYNTATREVALNDLVRRELIRQECEKKSIVPTDADLAMVKRQFMNGIRLPKVPFEKYIVTLPKVESEEIRKQLYADALGERFLKSWATNDFTKVSDQEVSNRVSIVRESRLKVAVLNAESRKRAAAAKAEILSGASSFYEVTTNRAEVFKEQGQFWDIVELADLDPQTDLFNFLATAKTGDISDPLDFDDGIGIVGVLLKEKEKEASEKEPPQTDAAPQVYQYTLVRCMFNGYEPIDEPEDFSSAKKLLLERKKKEAQQALVEELYKNARIEFPFGKNLFANRKNAKRKNAKQSNTRGKAKKPSLRKQENANRKSKVK